VKAALAGCVLFAVACGRHDTPVASYGEPLPDTGGGGNAGSGGSAGSPAGAPEAGTAAESACVELYTTTVPGLTSHYRLSVTGLIWIDAERDCESDGGHLVVIDDDAENDWVKSIAEQSVTNDASTNELVWIGLEDHATEGQYRWVTDAPLGTPRWAAGEPNNRGKIEDCGEMRGSGEWNDDRCNARPIFICECDGAVARGWCDTDADATCGDCSTSCASDQTCVGQVCK
jgi:hypothetical protein